MCRYKWSLSSQVCPLGFQKSQKIWCGRRRKGWLNENYFYNLPLAYYWNIGRHPRSHASVACWSSVRERFMLTPECLHLLLWRSINTPVITDIAQSLSSSRVYCEDAVLIMSSASRDHGNIARERICIIAIAVANDRRCLKNGHEDCSSRPDSDSPAYVWCSHWSCKKVMQQEQVAIVTVISWTRQGGVPVFWTFSYKKN